MNKYLIILRSADRQSGNPADCYIQMSPNALPIEHNKYRCRFVGLSIPNTLDVNDRMESTCTIIEFQCNFSNGRYFFDTSNEGLHTMAFFQNTQNDAVLANWVENVVNSDNGFEISCDNVNNKLIRFRLFDVDNLEVLTQDDGTDLVHEWSAYFEFSPLD